MVLVDEIQASEKEPQKERENHLCTNRKPERWQWRFGRGRWRDLAPVWKEAEDGGGINKGRLVAASSLLEDTNRQDVGLTGAEEI